jgi:hypothetical protein
LSDFRNVVFEPPRWRGRFAVSEPKISESHLVRRAGRHLSPGIVGEILKFSEDEPNCGSLSGPRHSLARFLFSQRTCEKLRTEQPKLSVGGVTKVWRRAQRVDLLAVLRLTRPIGRVILFWDPVLSCRGGRRCNRFTVRFEARPPVG